MNVSGIPLSFNGSTPALDQVVNDPKVTEEQKIGEVSKQFEAALLRQILDQAMKTTFHSGLMPDNTANSIYKDFVTSNLADTIAQNGGLGLASSLQTQLTQQIAPGRVKTESAPAKEGETSHE